MTMQPTQGVQEITSYERWLLDDRQTDPLITVRELTRRERAELALLDLQCSDEEWLDEDETTEYTREALVLEELDDDALDELFALEDEDGLGDAMSDEDEPWFQHIRPAIH
jgi:hypothetical protein